MNFELSDEQEQLRDTVRRFLTERAPVTYVRARWDDPRGTTDDVWRGLAALGAAGLLVPEEHGGAGGGMVDAAVVCEELGRAVDPGPYASTAVGAAGLVRDAGTAEDRASLLPDLASGAVVATVALLEPGRRATWTEPTVRAERTGDGWSLTGTKVHVADLIAADVVLVAATAGDGFGVFAVDAADARREPTPTVDPTRREGTLVLDGTQARRIGTSDPARVLAATAATVDRLHTAAVVDGVGAATRALELAVEHAKARHQFGVPIGSFQAVQHLCADMLRDVELARAAAYYACWALDAADAAEGHRAATMALAFAADGLYGVGANAIQVHGGVGYTWEHDAHLYYKRLLTLQGLGGGSTDQLEELASIILDG